MKVWNARRLDFGVGQVSFPKLNLKHAISEIEIGVEILAKNPTKSAYEIDQIHVDVLTESGIVVAEQKTLPIDVIRIEPNGVTSIPFVYLISALNLGLLIKENGGISKISMSMFAHGVYGINLRMKGFIVIEGFKIHIDEIIQR